MAHDPDPERLEALEQRLDALKEKTAPKGGSMKGVGGGELAWRMVLELMTGMGLGLGIGYGLDSVFGTKPILMIVFVLLGFAAGIRTMLRTAADMGKKAEGPLGDEKRNEHSGG